MSQEVKKPPRMFSGLPGRVASAIGITVAPSEPMVKIPSPEPQSIFKTPTNESAVQDVMTAQSVDKGAPNLGVVETSVSSEGPQSIESIGSKVPAPHVTSEATFVSTVSAEPSSPVGTTVEQPVIVPVQQPAENVVQNPAPITPEDPVSPTIPESPVQPTAELVGLEATPPGPKVETPTPEIHMAEPAVEPTIQATAQDFAQAEPEAPAALAPEEDKTEEPEVKVDPIATSLFVENPDLIKDGVVDIEAYKKAREAKVEAQKQQEKADNLVAQLKSLGVDPKAIAKIIDENVAKWLENKLAA